MKVPVMIQMQPGDNGITALAMVMAAYGRYVSNKELRTSGGNSRNGISPEDLAETARGYGMSCKVEHVPTDSLVKLPASSFPCIARYGSRRYVVVCALNDKLVRMNDPSKGSVTITTESFGNMYRGVLLVPRPGEGFVREGHPSPVIPFIKNRILPRIRDFIRITALDVVLVVFGFFSITLNREMLDTVIGEQRADLYIAAIALMTAVILLRFFADIGKTAAILKTTRQMAGSVNSAMFRKLLNLPARFYESHENGDLVNRFENSEEVNKTLIQSLIPSLISGITAVIYLIAMFSYSVPLSILICSLHIAYCVINYLLSRRIAIVSRSSALSSASLHNISLNGFGMMDTIRATAGERTFFSSWLTKQLEHIENSDRQQNLSSAADFISSMIGHLCSTLMLIMGAYLIINGQFTLGMLSAFQSIAGNARSSLSSTLSVQNTMQKIRAVFERENDILDEESKPVIRLDDDVTASNLKGDISVRNISFKYNPADPYAVRDISLDIGQGQMIALVGRSGCGKSTLLQLIGARYAPLSGSVTYDGKLRNEIPDVVFHSSVGIVEQEAVLFEDSIDENIRLSDRTIEYFDECLACMDAQIIDRILKEPNAFYSPILENGSNFSGGELQRFELARTLAIDPAILLLDEFTSSLDTITEQKVVEAIRARSVTCILAAHRLSTIVNCDRIYVMDKGRIIDSGTHEELLERCELYSSLVRSDS